jgi:hypothetical protein
MLVSPLALQIRHPPISLHLRLTYSLRNVSVVLNVMGSLHRLKIPASSKAVRRDCNAVDVVAQGGRPLIKFVRGAKGVSFSGRRPGELMKTPTQCDGLARSSLRTLGATKGLCQEVLAVWCRGDN